MFTLALLSLVAISAMYSLPRVNAQLANAFAIPQAIATPDLSNGKWLSGEFGNDSLDLKVTSLKGLQCEMNCPPVTIFPHMRLNHDSDYLYILADLARDTTLKDDTNTLLALDTPNNGLGICNTPGNFLIVFLLKGSGSSPNNYKLDIQQLCGPVPDFDKVKGNWSYGSSMYNNQSHVIMKEAIPISTLTKYRPTSDVNGLFGLNAEIGNTASPAEWPSGATEKQPYGKLYLSGQTSVDFFPPGMDISILLTSILCARLAPKGFASLRRLFERAWRLAK